MDKFGLRSYFEHIFLSCDLHLIKTDENFFKTVLSQAGLAQEDCLMVGDSIQSDMDAAKKAGLNTILLDRKKTRNYPQKIESLKELTSFLSN